MSAGSDIFYRRKVSNRTRRTFQIFGRITIILVCFLITLDLRFVGFLQTRNEKHFYFNSLKSGGLMSFQVCRRLTITICNRGLLIR